MSELELLKMQKKEIEAKIKALSSEEYHRCGRVKFEKPKEGIYNVSILCKQSRTKYESRKAYENRTGRDGNYFCNREELGTFEVEAWYSFIKETDKNKAVTVIDQTINDLKGLRKMIIEEGEINV